MTIDSRNPETSEPTSLDHRRAPTQLPNSAPIPRTPFVTSVDSPRFGATRRRWAITTRAPGPGTRGSVQLAERARWTTRGRNDRPGAVQDLYA